MSKRIPTGMRGGLRRAMAACLAAGLTLGMAGQAGLAGCAAAPAPEHAASHGPASASTGGQPGLLRGDRVTIDRDFVHLDDPLFLQRKSVYAFRKAGFFTFQLPIYFNAGQDTLRFASDGIRIRTKIPGADPGPEGQAGRTIDMLPPLPPDISCVADTGDALADSAAVAGMFRDTGRILEFRPGRGRDKRVQLNIHCIGYDPPRGRVDTLSLAFGRINGTAPPRETVFDLPFHVSFRGPVVSILLGAGLLYGFTQAGLWISGM